MQVSDQSSLKILILQALVHAQDPTLNANNLFLKFRRCRFTVTRCDVGCVLATMGTAKGKTIAHMWIVCHGKSVPELQQIFMDCIFGMIIPNRYKYSGFALVTEDGTVFKDGKGGKGSCCRK